MTNFCHWLFCFQLLETKSTEMSGYTSIKEVIFLEIYECLTIDK